MFHLRGTESSAEFSGRVSDVFAALGTGSVKRHTEQQEDLSLRPDFDKQQLARAVRPAPPPPAAPVDRRDAEEFKRPSPVVPRRPATDDRQQRRWSSGRDRDNDSWRRGGGGGGGGGGGRRGRGAALADHRRNPQNWTKYSLADVTTDQLSDRSNTSAALDFLKQLRRRNAAAARDAADSMAVDEEEEPPADLSQPITFRKPPSNTSSARVKKSTNVKKMTSTVISTDEENEETSVKSVVGKEKIITVMEEEKDAAAVDDRQPVVFRKRPFNKSSRLVAINDTSPAIDTSTEADSGENMVSSANPEAKKTGGAFSGGDKKEHKKGKSAKAVMLSHLADEEDD